MPLRRYFHTIRHLRRGQILSRLHLQLSAVARTALPTLTHKIYANRAERSGLLWPQRLLALAPAEAVLAQSDPESTRQGRTRASAALQGHFEYCNDNEVLGWPPDWSAHKKARLWRFHLHYFDELVDIALFQRDAERQVPAVIDDWIRHNPIHSSDRDAWHPYVVSTRVVNWMLALSHTTQAELVTNAIRKSLLEHAIFLQHNLETDVGGNHLLKNLKALSIIGFFWAGKSAEAWQCDYTNRFIDELGRQILSDGGHYERSPIYHCQVLCDALEVFAIAQPDAAVRLGALRLLIERMLEFLTVVTHPGGEVALFNDSPLDFAPRALLLRRAGERLSGVNSGGTTPRLELVLQSLSGARRAPTVVDEERRDDDVRPSSGYVRLPGPSSDALLLADVGEVCPDDLPAHAHADTLSYELSLGGQRIIVDSGVGDYAPGRWRDYYRSTRAHNTVMIDGSEQSDCWGSFRVGRRAKPRNVHTHFTDRETILEAEHTGYLHLAGRPSHRRRFSWHEEGYWLIEDAIEGEGVHSWTSFCHFHPTVKVIAHDHLWWRVAREQIVLDISAYGFQTSTAVTGSTEPLQGWYAERLGASQPALTIVFEGTGSAPARFGYTLQPQLSLGAARSAVTHRP